jgi:hypothetical protein
MSCLCLRSPLAVPLCGHPLLCSPGKFYSALMARLFTCVSIAYRRIPQTTQKTGFPLCRHLTFPSVPSVKHTLCIVHVHSALILLRSSIYHILYSTRSWSMPRHKIRTIQQTLSFLRLSRPILEAVISGPQRLPPTSSTPIYTPRTDCRMLCSAFAILPS